MMRGRLGAVLGLAAMVSGCGGGGGSSGNVTGATGGSGSVGTTPTPAPTPTPAATCSLRARQDWVAAQLREWYLFPETLPASLDPTPFASVDAYVDALTATARAQRRDRFFTYTTSIREENAYYESGSSAGFGIRIAREGNRLLVSEAFEGGPALAAGIDRGTEILAIGTTPGNLQLTSTLIAAGGTALDEALGPSTAGLTRLLRISGAAGVREITVAKADFTLQPVSPRYGTQVFDDGGRRVGYVNLRTFISTADPALRAAFAQFREQGITNLIVDLRYNGGGLVATAELMGDLLGRDRTSADVQGYTSFRPEKASNNTTRSYRPQAESIAPARIAFIGTGSTASASELVINGVTPYLRDRSALIGTNTFGKPVGQIALDREACDDRLRVVAFAVQNSVRSAAYFDGLATTVEASCQAADDLAFPLGDRREASIARALDFLAGRPCTRIGSSTGTITGQSFRARELVTPTRPDTAQREVPGLF